MLQPDARHTLRLRPSSPRIAAAFLLALLSACSESAGSDSGGGSGPDVLDEGTYAVGNYDYVDPNPVGVHPLGTSSQVVTELAEQLVIVPYDSEFILGGTGGEMTQVWVEESQTEGFGEVPGSQDLFGAGRAMRGAASGNLDDDAAREYVAAEILEPGGLVRLVAADRLENGQVRLDVLASFTSGSYFMKDARVELADLDGDFRDELIVVARSNFFGYEATRATVRVFDDPESGGLELMNMDRNGNHVEIWAWPADVDGDGRFEVVVSLGGDTTNDGYHAVRLYDLPDGADTMVRVHDWVYLSKDNNTSGIKSAVGDFDGDGMDEIATAKTSFPTGQCGVLLHGWDDGEVEPQGSVTINSQIHAPGARHWTMTAFERHVGRDEVAVMIPRGPTSNQKWWITLLAYDEVQDTWTQSAYSLAHPHYGHLPALATGDLDADGKEELQWALLRSSGNQSLLWRGYLAEAGAGITQHNLPYRTFPGSPAGIRNPVLVPGDWDADGLVLEYTGRKFFQMARPIPLAVLSAPPTHIGITQNYDDSDTQYETGFETSQTWGVTSGTTLSGAVGAEFDVFGLIKAGGKATLEETLTNSQFETTKVSYVSGYTGSWAEDVVIFEGTMNQIYEYWVVSAPDPSAVGRYVTLNVPVASQTYNWTVDYFNSQMAPEDQIGADILTHTPGDVNTYPTFSELDAMVEGSLHWYLPSVGQVPGSQEVGEGLGSNYLEIAFANESTSEQQRTVSVGGEGAVGFGVTASGGSSTESGSIYSVTYSDTSRFAGTVGKIDDDQEHQDYNYYWSLVVETHGRTADANNVPTGYVPGVRPFQLVRYWVNRVGGSLNP